tara:strand:- start:1170 stop:2231 length:1062 start_codon:yes stop_codon:yes gene_type:complete
MTLKKKQLIECQSLWKIFGQKAKTAMQAVKERNLTKEQVHNEFDCIVGVQNATFSVDEGEIFCIMGLSGSGKSTLIRHINRLIEPTSGEIFIDGENINNLNQTELREIRSSKIGMVFQNMALLPHKNVRENVAFALELRGIDKKSRDKVANETLETVELSGWGDRYPDELSGGMQQRVGLARAIAANPQILLMDEPFSALDPLIRRQLQDQFIELSQIMHKTTIFITHDLDEAIRIGQRIAIMKDGMLVQIGEPEDIVTDPVDDYVAKFVSGISNLHLVTAGKIMQSIAEYEASAGPVKEESLLKAKLDDDLDCLIDLSIKTDEPILIESESKIVGIVSKKTLLAGIQGHWNT